MAKPLSILFITSEVIPFAKVGGIADVSYSLPLALRDFGHDTRVMLPKYGIISERKNRIHEINRLRDMPIEVAGAEELATVKSSSIQNPRVKVQAYITTNHKYFDSKKGIYIDPKTGVDFTDNDERFMFFNKTVIETCLLLGWFPDIIHCNDWQTSLIPAYAKSMFPEEFKKTKIVLTIHNFNQQGEFSIKSFAKTGLPKEIKEHFTHKRKMNFLKGGIHFADYVTTVSPTHEQQMLKDSKLGNGLNTFINDRKSTFKGILNGIDSWTWNPEKDKLLKHKLKTDFNKYKSKNKEALLSEFDWEDEMDTPLIGMILKLDEDKGVSLFLDSAKELFNEDIKLIMLANGISDYRKKLEKLADKHPDKFKVIFGFDEELAHRIEAGSDMFLMPSLYEACGLNSMYSLAYGSIPIVRAVGGFTDIVSDYNQKTNEGNGFSFKKYDTIDLMKTVRIALNTFKDKETWSKIIKNGRSKDFSWDDSIQKYDKIYRKILKVN